MLLRLYHALESPGLVKTALQQKVTTLKQLQKVKVKSLSRVWLCDPMDCSLPCSSIHGIFQARVLESVAIFFSKSSYTPIKNKTKNPTKKQKTAWSNPQSFKLSLGWGLRMHTSVKIQVMLRKSGDHTGRIIALNHLWLPLVSVNCLLLPHLFIWLPAVFSFPRHTSV